MGHCRFLAAVCPLVGPFIAAGFPVALAAAIDPGWGIALETLALFLLLSIIGQGVEPWLYGRNAGISPIAVVISATFWTWLWGTVGLVLSTPLSVCLVVLGRHVERLAFLDVIFGDAPPFTPVEKFYQRGARRGRLGSRRPSRTILENQLTHRLLRRGGAPRLC